MSENKLKLCPFCGGKARDPFYYDPFDGYQGNLGRYRIRCSKCSAEIEERTKEEAIEAWNRRAEDYGMNVGNDDSVEWYGAVSVCSICGCNFMMADDDELHHCPNCGRKLREKDGK